MPVLSKIRCCTGRRSRLKLGYLTLSPCHLAPRTPMRDRSPDRDRLIGSDWLMNQTGSNLLESNGPVQGFLEPHIALDLHPPVDPCRE